MTESTEKPQAQTQPQFAIQKIYGKDLSFETPGSATMFNTSEWKPEVNVELDTKSSMISEDSHEIVLGVTVTTKLGEKVAFIAEVHQAGLFVLKGFRQEEKAVMIGSYCPNILFPYAREVISDLVTKGGFPQLLLAPVNFDALYQQHLSRQQEGKATGSNNDAVH